MTARADILSAVDGEWRPAREIHKRIGMWSKTTVHHELRLLAIAGEVEEKRQPIPSGEVALFRAKPRE